MSISNIEIGCEMNLQKVTNSEMNKTIRLIRDNKNYKLDYPSGLIN